MTPEEYLQHDATSLADLVARKEVSAAELLALARARRDAVNPALNAVVADLDAPADERAADPSLAGPFAGVPFLVKDLGQEYTGFPTSNGSRALRDDVATEHALVTQRFLDAGLVVFGKTNTPEFGAKGITEPTLFGPARNPWDTSRTPGGSSGGSGAAVAAGVVPAAGANDGGGSIRIPAACNGLFGLKTSRGLGPYGPQRGEEMFGMVTQGVVSRTVRDSAGLLDAIIAPNASAYFQGAAHDSFLDRLGERPEGLRIGWSASSAINDAVDPEAHAAVQAAAELLESLGHHVEEVAPPHDDEQLARDFLTIWFAQVHGQVQDIKARLGSPDSHFEADTLATAELGRSAGVGALFEALRHVNDHVKALAQFHESYDLLLTPTLAKPPLEVGSINTPKALQLASTVVAKLRGGMVMTRLGVLDDIVSDNIGWVPYTQLANLTGRPAMSVPLHWTATGVPLGVQLVGPLGADGLLLRLAAQLEEAQPWVQRYAPMQARLG